MRSLFALVLLTLSATATAQAQTNITILDYGIVSGTNRKKVPAPDAAMGFIQELSNYKFVRQAETIPAKQGVRFGIRFRVDGAPKGKLLKIRCITRFPEGGVTTPKGEKMQAGEYDCALKGGEVTWRSYTFDEPWEMVPGLWNLEFWLDGQKIGEKRFAVVAP